MLPPSSPEVNVLPQGRVCPVAHHAAVREQVRPVLRQAAQLEGGRNSNQYHRLKKISILIQIFMLLQCVILFLILRRSCYLAVGEQVGPVLSQAAQLRSVQSYPFVALIIV